MGLRFAVDLSPSSWAAARKDQSPSAVRAAVNRTIEVGRIADAAGVDSIWALEDPDGWDAFAVLGAIARETSRIRLGTGVTNPYYRHPSQLAASVATLDHLSDGRAFLGLGRGQQEWYRDALGIAVGKPVRALDETMSLLQQWWSPEMRASSDPDATEFQIRQWERVIRPLQATVPIYLAAVGPLALKLAGRRFDGALFNDLASRTFLKRAIDTVRAGAIEAGRDPSTLSFCARVAARVTDDPEAVYEQRKTTVAMILALPGMDALLESPNFDTRQIMADVRAVMRTDEVLSQGGGFGDLRRAGDLDAAKRAIPTDLMRELAVVGSVSEVRGQLADLAAMGITDVFLAGLNQDATVESVAGLIADLAGTGS